MDPIHIALPEEIALEGLDGITLDALWFRLSERLNLSLPLSNKFQNDIWKLILSRSCFEFYEIADDRPTPKKMDRKEYYFNTDIPDQEIKDHLTSTYYIYSYHPVDHPEIRGSCQEFNKRKKLTVSDLEKMSLHEVEERFNRRLVIVAIQNLRNSVLIPNNVGREVDINNVVYCILERIGRARYFGEATSGAFSLFDFVKDSKLLHYFRNSLLKNQLVNRQPIQARVRGQLISGQLFHLPRFYVIVRASHMVLTEKLFDFLLNKPFYAAEITAVRELLGVTQKYALSLIRSRPNVFRHDPKTPYRECYPNATNSESFYKNKVERSVNAVKLIDPTMDLSVLWDKEDEEVQGEEKGFFDTSKQKLNRSLTHQVYEKIEESGKDGLSQLEISHYFGLTKLNARSIIRKLQRSHNVSFYMKDEGRQRFAKYVTKDAAHHASLEFLAEMAKLMKQIPIPPPLSQTNDVSPTKVSIPLSPSALNKLKEESDGIKPVVQVTFQKPVEEETEAQDVEDHTLLEPKVIIDQGNESKLIPMIFPAEEFSFVDNVDNVKVSMRFLNSIPEGQKPCTGIAQDISTNKISQKVLERMNAILDIVKTSTVIDLTNLWIRLRQKEKKDKLPVMLCKKSLLTLCAKLAADNFLKVIEMELKSEKKTVKLMFFGEPNVSFDMRCWNSIIEEQKIHNFVPFYRHEVSGNGPELETSMSALSTSLRSENLGAQAKSLEKFPKFMKLKLFHEFLYYLIYAYPPDHKKIPINKAIEVWTKVNPKTLEYEPITENISNCYSTEISWKMFVSPLNQQLEYGNGWALLRDIIHRIPLSLFVKFTRYAQGTAELNKFLSHPIKCNYLLHFLPGTLRESLLHGRKYIFIVQELCKKLCWCGLLQFGPTRTKEIDQTFIYLNRNASLWDTSSSEPGYLETSDKDYPVIRFTFNTVEAVSDYWNEMYKISMKTKLNHPSLAIGKVVEFASSSSKPELQAAQKVQTPKSAPLNDVGEIPGDHKGAAGLDKTFWAHLRSSWTRAAASKSVRGLSQVSETAVARKVKKKLKKNIVKETAAKIKNKSISVAQSKFKEKTGVVGINSRSRLIKKPFYNLNAIRKKELIAQDAVDKEALKQLKTLRVCWSDAEDKTLMLTKVAVKFVFSNESQAVHYISQSIYRDILHWRTSKALDKTSKACARRIHYLMKSKQLFRDQVALYIEELRTNHDFNLKYRNLVDRLKEIYPPDSLHCAVKIHVVEMVHRLHQIFFKEYLNNPDEAADELGFDLPNDYDQLVKNFTITNPTNTQNNFKYFKDPKTTKEAEISMLMSVIHSAACCNQEMPSYLHQLFEVYKKFPDSSLSAAVSSLKRSMAISANKKDKNKERSILPYAFSPFHLSTRYAAQLMCVHVPVELYDEYLKAVKTISDSSSYQINNVNCGWVFMLAELISTGKIALSYDLVEKLVMVDPALQKRSNFEKISDKYMERMSQKQLVGEKRMKSVKFQSDDNIDETFLYNEDPIEIFFKINSIHLHTICALEALIAGEEVKTKTWTVTEGGECILEKCIMKESDKFDENIRRIAASGKDMISDILKSSLTDNKNRNVITKHNFISFFDCAIKTHQNDAKDKTRKDFGGKALFSCKHLTTSILLESMKRLAVESELEEGSWLNEYKKVTRKPEEEGLDDEDLDPNVDQIRHSKMISQLKDLNVSGRTSDSFVVNLSTIYVDVKDKQDDKIQFQGIDFEKSLMPFTEIERDELLEKILNEAKFKPEDLDSDRDLFDELRSVGITKTLEIMQISEVVDLIQSKGRMGAKSDDLLEMFPDQHRLQKQMETLLKIKFVIKVGVIETRFIHKEFAAYWLIDTFFSTREKENEATEQTATNEPEAKRAKVAFDGPSTSTAPGPSEQEVVVESTTETQKPPMILNPIRVRPSPWIRVNGTLNRRVIDKWLGTVLNHLTVNLGVFLSDLNSKFNVLTPFDMRWLCEILQLIGCVQLMSITEAESDLFSNHFETTVETATFFCPPNKVFIDVNDDAMQRLTFFIGRKKYKTPFI